MSVPVESPRGTRRAMMLVVGLLASIITFVVGANVALAHHAYISTSIDCTFTVSWTARSWSTNSDNHEGANSSIEVGYGLDAENDGDLDDNNNNEIDSGENPVVLATKPFADFKAGSNPRVVDSFSGTFAWPDNTQSSIIVYTVPRANWGNGVTDKPLEQSVVTRPTNCPGVPSASIDCVAGTAGKVEVSMSVGAGSGNVTFSFSSVPSSTVKGSLSVASGTALVKAPFVNVANGTSVSVSAPGMATVTKTVNCGPGTPTASADVVCANLSGTVSGTLVVSPGTNPVTFTLDFPGTTNDQTIVVNAGQSTPFSVTGVPNGTVSISAPGLTTIERTINCAPGAPSATATATCVNASGTVAITLSVAPGGAPIEFTVSVPGQAPAVHSVASGSSKDLSFSSVPNGTVSITAPGLQTVTAEINCTLGTPSVTVAPVCSSTTTATVLVTFSVTGGNVPFTFSGDAPIGTFTLTAGQTTDVIFTGAPTTGFNVNYTVNGVASSTAVPAVTCSQTESQPPVPPTEPPVLTPPPVSQLPATGTSGLSTMLTLGFVFLGLGCAAIYFGRRRVSSIKS